MLGHAGFFEFANDTGVDVVGLSPDLAVDDVEVRDDLVDAAQAIPPRRHDQVALAGSIRSGSSVRPTDL